MENGDRELEKEKEKCERRKGNTQQANREKKGEIVFLIQIGPVRSSDRSGRSKPGPDRRPKTEMDRTEDRTETPRSGPVRSGLHRSSGRSGPGPFNEHP